MSGHAKDPTIKLFGKTIPLPEVQQSYTPCFPQQYKNIDVDADKDAEQKQDEEEVDITIYDKELSYVNLRTHPLDNENSTPSDLKPEEKRIEKGDARVQKITPKKPKKILPCPRCDSMATKFCYYNNHNLNQPRHFCKNCHRYWTAGGLVRNVPMGAGKRKSKSSSASFNNRCQPDRHGGQMFKHPGGSSETSPMGHEAMIHLSFASQISCFPGAAWAYPWVPALPMLPTPTLCPPPVFPLPIYPITALSSPAGYWGCGFPPIWSTIPCLPQPNYANTNPSTDPSPVPNSSTLGKHPREEDTLEHNDFGESDNEKNGGSIPRQCLPILKALRFDDPRDAANSSIWATLGNNKNDHKADSAAAGIFFKAFQPKIKEKRQFTEISPVFLQANPAALSRSVNFHESSHRVPTEAQVSQLYL